MFDEQRYKDDVYAKLLQLAISAHQSNQLRGLGSHLLEEIRLSQTRGGTAPEETRSAVRSFVKHFPALKGILTEDVYLNDERDESARLEERLSNAALFIASEPAVATQNTRNPLECADPSCNNIGVRSCITCGRLFCGRHAYTQQTRGEVYSQCHRCDSTTSQESASFDSKFRLAGVGILLVGVLLTAVACDKFDEHMGWLGVIGVPLLLCGLFVASSPGGGGQA